MIYMKLHGIISNERIHMKFQGIFFEEKSNQFPFSILTYKHSMGLVVIKPAFWVLEQARLKPACLATENS